MIWRKDQMVPPSSRLGRRKDGKPRVTRVSTIILITVLARHREAVIITTELARILPAADRPQSEELRLQEATWVLVAHFRDPQVQLEQARVPQTPLKARHPCPEISMGATCNRRGQRGEVRQHLSTEPD